MKKEILLLLLFISLSTFAQPPVGSIAPDFTVLDINGNSHTLSDYTNQGKNVIIKFFGTWCSPCWAQHQGFNELKQLYTAFGSVGSNDLVILYVECSDDTTIEDIYGTGSNTLGNYVEGTPYPIIHNYELKDLYNISAVPTTVTICPNRIIDEETDFFTAFSFFGEPTELSCAEFEGLDNYIGIYAAKGVICDGSVGISAHVQNYGVNDIDNIVLNLKMNGEILQTVYFQGSLRHFKKHIINFPTVDYDPNANYEIEIESVNNTDAIVAEADYEIVFTTSQYLEENEIEIQINTDNYPAQMSWNLINSMGNIIVSGGPYEYGIPELSGAGGPDAHTTKVHYAILPDAEDCYSMELFDSGNNGWNSEGIEIINNGETLFENKPLNFGSYTILTNIFSTDGASLNSTVYQSEKTTIYPNPTSGLLYLTSSDESKITVADNTGKNVYKETGFTSKEYINLSHLQKGLYFLTIEFNNSIKRQKIVLQ